jgi:hypothetical protein
MEMTDLIWKEHTEGMRRKQYFAIGILLLGFALLSPVMMKALPALLEAQTGSQEMAAAIPVNLRESLRSFIKNIHQIATLLLVYLGASQIAYERNQRVVFPLHAGLALKGLVWAKALVYGLAIFLLSLGASAITVIYGQLLLPGNWQAYSLIGWMGMEVGLYLFVAYLTGMVFAAWISNKMLAAVLGSLTLFLIGWLAGFTEFAWIFPTYLMKEANYLTAYWTKPLAGSLMMVLVWSVLMVKAVGWKLNRTNMMVREDAP